MAACLDHLYRNADIVHVPDFWREFASSTWDILSWTATEFIGPGNEPLSSTYRSSGLGRPSYQDTGTIPLLSGSPLCVCLAVLPLFSLTKDSTSARGGILRCRFIVCSISQVPLLPFPNTTRYLANKLSGFSSNAYLNLGRSRTSLLKSPPYVASTKLARLP